MMNSYLAGYASQVLLVSHAASGTTADEDSTLRADPSCAAGAGRLFSGQGI
jgi:hypothetical protein